MDDLERVLQPRTLQGREERQRLAKVVLVLVEMVLGLVQQLDVGRYDRDTRRGARCDLVDRFCHPLVAPALPDPILDVVEEELELLGARIPRFRGRTASRGTKQDLVDRQLEPLVLLPRQPARHRLEQPPAGEERPEVLLIVAEDPYLDVLVLPRHLADEEIDRPAAAHEPRVRKALQLMDGRVDLLEDAQASFSRTSWLTAEPSARPATCGITSAITRPKSRMLVAPTSAIASSTISSRSSSGRGSGMNSSSTRSSASSAAACSSRPAARKASAASSRRLRSRCRTWSSSSSWSGRRSSFSAERSDVRIRRSASRRAESRACIASFSSPSIRPIRLTGGSPAHERVEGVGGNREVPPHEVLRRGLVGETLLPPR